MSRAPVLKLRIAGRVLELGPRPWLMGIVNTTPDSFSDAAELNLDGGLALAEEQIEAGAGIIDVGGESGRTDRPPVEAGEEIERVVPLIKRLAAARPDALISIDTYKPGVADAAVGAGAAIVNDTSGLRDPELADVCAASGAALVLMHTVGAPKQKVLDHPYADVPREVAAFLAERIELAQTRGVAFEQLLLDPGPDFGKSPAQTVAALRGLDALHALGRPLLMAISRKDFVGALTGRAPRARAAGTLAALAAGLDAGAHVFRVHDVAAAADFIAVRDALSGRREVPSDLRLADHLRRQPPFES